MRISFGLLAGASFAGVAALAGGLSIAIGMYSNARTLDAALNDWLTGLQSSFNQAIHQEINRASALAVNVASDPDTISAFAVRDRQLLEMRYVPVFAALRRSHGVAQFQFHLEPATSFLRVHRPGRHGDDLSSFRHTVVEANREKRIVNGLEFGVEGLGIRSVIPVNDGARHLGTVEIGLTFGQPFFDAFAREQRVNAALFVQDSKGMKPFASTLPAGYIPSLPALEAVQGMGGQQIQTGVLIEGKEYAQIIFPARDYRGDAFGLVVIALDTARFADVGQEARYHAVLAGLLALFLSALAAFVMHRAAARPIRQLSVSMIALARGDMSARPQTCVIGEICDMADAYETFRVASIERDQLRVEAEAARLDIEQRRIVLERAIDGFKGRMTKAITMLGQTASGLDDSAAAMTKAAAQSSIESAAVASAAEQTSVNVQGVAAAGEQLSASIGTIGEQVRQSGEVAARAVVAAQDSESKVQRLSRSVENIGAVIGMINTIAGQTNLLALNATIEAARAGEAGKGFAVVASEVKELANQTQRATGEIAGMIAEIQSVSLESTRSISEITATIGEIDTVFRLITDSIGQQATATAEISDNVQQAAHGTEEVSRAISVASQAASTTGKAAQDVESAVDTLTQQADSLNAEMERFIEEVLAA